MMWKDTRSFDKVRKSVLQLLQMLRFLNELDFHITPWDVSDQAMFYFQSGDEASSKTLSLGVVLTLFSRSIFVYFLVEVSNESQFCLSSALITSSIQILFLNTCQINQWVKIWVEFWEFQCKLHNS